MRIPLISLATVACVLFSPSLLLADTVYLKNGNTLKGFVEKESQDTVEFNLGYGSVTLLKGEIARVVKSNTQESQVIWDEWNQRKKEEALRRPEQEKRERERKAEADRLREEERTRKGGGEYGPKEVRVSTQDGHFFVNVLLNGKVRARLLLDSGATMVALPERVADQLGIDMNQLKKEGVRVADGRVVESAKSLLESVEVLRGTDNPVDFKPTGVKIDNVEASFLTRANDVIVDTGDKVYVPDDGLLGMSFLKHFQLKLDYENKKIVFQKTPVNRAPTDR